MELAEWERAVVPGKSAIRMREELLIFCEFAEFDATVGLAGFGRLNRIRVLLSTDSPCRNILWVQPPITNLCGTRCSACLCSDRCRRILLIGLVVRASIGAAVGIPVATARPSTRGLPRQPNAIREVRRRPTEAGSIGEVGGVEGANELLGKERGRTNEACVS